MNEWMECKEKIMSDFKFRTQEIDELTFFISKTVLTIANYLERQEKLMPIKMLYIGDLINKKLSDDPIQFKLVFN